MATVMVPLAAGGRERRCCLGCLTISVAVELLVAKTAAGLRKEVIVEI